MTTSLQQIPCLPSNAPFTLEQRAWINGFLAGVFSFTSIENPATQRPAALEAPKAGPLLILWGSQTGTAESLAKRIAKEATARGYEALLLDAAKHGEVDWAKQKRLLLVTSTWGDGEPPDNAQGFWSALNSPAAPSLAHVEFAVLGLGDKNYSSFCGAGKRFDERLAALGAKRIAPCAECDVDYEATAKAWLELFWSGQSSVQSNLLASTIALPASGHSRSRPFTAPLLTARILNAPGSAKETRHFEFSLEGSGLSYDAGDALGVFPSNDPALVSAILEALEVDGDTTLSLDGVQISFREALLDKLDITRLSRDLLNALSVDNGEAAVRSWDLLDLLAATRSAKMPAAELVTQLKKLQPRLYSISSSPAAHAGQVHLTVSIVRYEAHGRWRGGVCSTYMADRLSPGAAAPIFVHKSPHFRLPADADRPVIMVGPGTGIAPFRAFLHERAATGAKGKNWLFFGDQRKATDFLYQSEMESFVASGVLNELDLAFSRDQAAKVYVQDKMRERGAELWKWLEEGAHFYVCGDASRMAKDVDAALHEVIESAGGLSRDAAADYVQKLKTEKRYQRDVY
ncbi:MAG TPA: sulfite reductase subunit alpha [Methylomirabilota bacterium]|nr:sulfite reductase subunit alpha [Methylomirabilota bacterium]